MTTDRRPGPNVWLLLRVGLIGGALARLLRSPGRFVIVALVGTALSLIPPLVRPMLAQPKLSSSSRTWSPQVSSFPSCESSSAHQPTPSTKRGPDHEH